MDTKFALDEKFHNLNLSDINFPNKYKALIQLLERHNIAHTLNDVASIDIEKFRQIQGTGLKKVLLLNNFINFIPSMLSLFEDTYLELQIKNPDYLITGKSDYTLNESFLNTDQVKIIAKIRKSIQDCNIGILMGDNIFNIHGCTSKKPKDIIKSIRKIIIEELSSDDNNLKIVVKSNYEPIPLEDLDLYILEDFEKFSFSIDDNLRNDIFMRLGFHQEELTLEKIGNLQNITRERVRQIINKSLYRLRFNLRVNYRVVKRNLLESDVSIAEKMPNLFSCFSSSGGFYNFLEKVFDIKRNEIYAPLGMIKKTIHPSLVHDFFVNNKSPVDYKEFLNHFIEGYGYSELVLTNYFNDCLLHGELKFILTNDKITPKNLDSYSAVANVLLDFPNGLPWRDIVAIIDNKGYSKNKIKIYTTGGIQRNPGCINTNTNLFLSSRGVYKHIKFLTIELADIEKLIILVAEHLNFEQVDSINLYDFYNHASVEVKSNDYFEFRHIFKVYSRDFGLYFSGRSGVDSVSNDKGFVRVTSTNVILNHIKKLNKAVTTTEIADMLRSKSASHASYYLEKMIAKRQVVRIDKMLYTTPDIAFKNVDMDSIVELIVNIIERDERPVGVDIIGREVNQLLGLSYSKYFYRAIALLNLKRFNWHNSHNLFSVNEIPALGVSGILSQLYKDDLSRQEMIKLLQENIRIGPTVANSAVNSHLYG